MVEATSVKKVNIRMDHFHLPYQLNLQFYLMIFLVILSTLHFSFRDEDKGCSTLAQFWINLTHYTLVFLYSRPFQ